MYVLATQRTTRGVGSGGCRTVFATQRVHNTGSQQDTDSQHIRKTGFAARGFAHGLGTHVLAVCALSNARAVANMGLRAVLSDGV